MQNAEEKIKKIVADTLGIDFARLGLHTNFKTDLKTDSLDMIEVIVAIENEFGISIPDEQTERIYTLQHATEYVNKTRPLITA